MTSGITQDITPEGTPGGTPALCAVQLTRTYEGGGCQRVAYLLARSLPERGVKSVAVSISDPGAYWEADGDHGAVICPLGTGELGKRPIQFLRLARKLARVLDEQHVSVIHSHGAGSALLAMVACAMARRKVRRVCSWHDSGSIPSGRGPYARLVRRAFRTAQAVCTPSADVRSRMRALLGRNEGVHLLTNGVPDLGMTDGHEAPVPSIAWAGRLDVVKNPLLLVRVLLRLHDEGYDFRCAFFGHAAAGDPHAARTLEAAGPLVKAGKMEFPGQVANLQRRLGTFSIGVQTSRTEGLSLALLEQMTAGLAIVATRAGQTAEALDGGRCGSLIEIDDADGLGDALRSMFDDPAARAALGQRARDLALERYTTSVMMDEALRLYGPPGR